ncbi:MAG: glycosyltransferase [Oscillospiraceae bacterium]|jgi:glycosyltransferase involved in cell wall biosynthesis|nr:glycosyltransferase [Oscillospiraceae bacterium]
MKKVLFLIPDLGVGGAEKVLVNLVNNMDKTKFDVTVLTIFNEGPNIGSLKKDVNYKFVFKKRFKGSTDIFKLFSPRFLYKWFVKGDYDIVVSYLEGPAARVISGCNNPQTKLISWVHLEQLTKRTGARSFRTYNEAKKCYNKFDLTVCVSQTVLENFVKLFDFKKPITVLYNTNETEQIFSKGQEPLDDPLFLQDEQTVKICGIGKIMPRKGYDKIARIHKRLLDEGIKQHVYILGKGPQQAEIEQYLKANKLEDSYTFLGYQQNLYKYVSKCDLFVCASLSEGFSTAATESLVLGVPVVTTLVSGMTEMLGENNEYGIITDNNEEALYQGIKKILTQPGLLEHYKKQAAIRGKNFSREKTVAAAEQMLLSL